MVYLKIKEAKGSYWTLKYAKLLILRWYGHKKRRPRTSLDVELVDRLGFSSNQPKVDFDGVFEALEFWRKVLEP